MRWVYFRKTVSDVVDKYHDDLEKLTNLEKLPEYLENICNELSGVCHEDHEIDKVEIKLSALNELDTLKNFQNGHLNWIQIEMRVIFIITPNLLKTILKKLFYVEVELGF